MTFENIFPLILQNPGLAAINFKVKDGLQFPDFTDLELSYLCDEQCIILWEFAVAFVLVNLVKRLVKLRGGFPVTKQLIYRVCRAPFVLHTPSDLCQHKYRHICSKYPTKNLGLHSTLFYSDIEEYKECLIYSSPDTAIQAYMLFHGPTPTEFVDMLVAFTYGHHCFKIPGKSYAECNEQNMPSTLHYFIKTYRWFVYVGPNWSYDSDVSKQVVEFKTETDSLIYSQIRTARFRALDKSLRQILPDDILNNIFKIECTLPRRRKQCTYIEGSDSDGDGDGGDFHIHMKHTIPREECEAIKEGFKWDYDQFQCKIILKKDIYKPEPEYYRVKRKANGYPPMTIEGEEIEDITKPPPRIMFKWRDYIYDYYYEDDL